MEDPFCFSLSLSQILHLVSKDKALMTTVWFIGVFGSKNKNYNFLLLKREWYPSEEIVLFEYKKVVPATKQVFYILLKILSKKESESEKKVVMTDNELLFEEDSTLFFSFISSSSIITFFRLW